MLILGAYKVKPKNAGGFSLITSVSAVTQTGKVIDRLGYSAGNLAVAYNGNVASTDTLTLSVLLASSDIAAAAATLVATKTLYTAAVVATGTTLVTQPSGVISIPIDFQALGRYIRVDQLHTLSVTTDVVTIGAILNLVESDTY